MPRVPAPNWGLSPKELLARGQHFIAEFCENNGIQTPMVNLVAEEDWCFDACAYYRKDNIFICVPLCASHCGHMPTRNWNWPGSTTDRTPFGVLAHELGHHCDRLAGVNKGKYYSEYCEVVMALSGEPPITSYAPNPAEWFAECFRLYVTNHALLKLIRPKTWKELHRRWTPVSNNDWLKALGPVKHVPERFIKALRNKMK